MAEETQDRLLHDLKLLASLREHDKLCVRDGLLAVHRPGAVTSLSRWFHGDGRQRTLAVVHNTLLDALQMAEYGVERVAAGRHGERDVVATHAQKRLIARLVRSVQQACVGLTRLRATYLDDASTAAKLDVLRERVTERLAAMQRWLEEHGRAALSDAPDGAYYAPAAPAAGELSTFVVFDSFPARQLRLEDDGGRGGF